MQLVLLFIVLAARFQAALATPVASDQEQSTSAEPRALPFAALPGLILDLIPQFIKLANEEDAECQFVDAVVKIATLSYRDMNVVMFKDKKSSYSKLVDRTCFEQDLPLAFFRTKTYTICVFKQGQFVRAGDGGCRNWGYGGCRTVNDRTINFCVRTATTTSKAPAVATSKAAPTTTPVRVVTTTSRAPAITTTSKAPPITTTIRVITTTTRAVPTTTSSLVTTTAEITPSTTEVIASVITETEVTTATVQAEVDSTTQSQLPATSRTSTTSTTPTTPVTPTTRSSQASVPRVTQPLLAAAAGGLAVAAFLMP